MLSTAVVVACLAGFAAPIFAAPEPYMVKDFNTAATGNARPALGAARGLLFFQAEDPQHGNELWASDGTPGSRRLVKDIVPGCAGSYPRDFVTAGDRVFFFAAGPERTVDLWTSDGTEEGTLLLEASLSELGSEASHELVAAGDRVYFTASKLDTGREIWTSDGTVEGTRIARDIAPGISVGSGPRFLRALGSRVVFWLYGAVDADFFWGSDGTEEGTLPIADIGPGRAGVVSVPFGDELFFTAADETHGDALWLTDGTAEGTRLVADVPPGPERFLALAGAALEDRIVLVARTGLDRLPRIWVSDGTEAGTRILLPDGPTPDGALVVTVGDEVFFSASDELWTTDGTEAGTSRVGTGVTPDSRDADPTRVAVVGARLFFAGAESFHGEELWVSGGGGFGTRFVEDIARGPAGSRPELLTPLGDRVYFFADDLAGGRELWTSDGTREGTVLLEDTVTANGTGFFPTRGIAATDDGAIYFSASGAALWRSDGTAEGTRVALDRLAGAESFDPDVFFSLGDRFLFWARVEDEGFEPWASDGTPEGTYPLGDLAAGSASSIPFSSVRLGRRLIFAFRKPDPASPPELWASDGTVAGTFLLGAWPECLQSANLPGLVVASGRVIFSACNEEHGTELWGTDGTAGSVERVADLIPGPQGSFPVVLESTTDGAFVVALDENNDRHLRVTDGTAAGTRVVSESLPIDPAYQQSAALGDRVVFLARAEDGDFCQLWTSDGTPQGTMLLLQTAADCDDGPIDLRLTTAGGRFYFSYDDLEHGEELWSSDGTPEGTGLVEDINPGPAGSNPFAMVASNGRLVFFADDGTHGIEPWTSDGTPQGTSLAGEVQPGDCGVPAAGDPAVLPGITRNITVAAAGGIVYFPADDGVHGSELWALPVDPGAARFVRGDCNDDGETDISDAVCILNWLFVDGAVPGCVGVTNTNGDAEANITDGTYLLNYLFLGGPPPAPPFPGCGTSENPADEELGCATPSRGC